MPDSQVAALAGEVARTMSGRGVAEAAIALGVDEESGQVLDITFWSLSLPKGPVLTGAVGSEELCLGRFDLAAPAPPDRFADDLFVALGSEGFVRHYVYWPGQPRDWLLRPARRWWTCRDDLPLEQMRDPTSADDPGSPDHSSEPGPEVTFQELRDSELFSWFGLAEVRRSAVAPDLTSVELEPGAFSGSIEVAVLLEPSEVVAGAWLGFERAFLDATKVNLAAATDLTTSILTFIAGADPLLGHVARQLEAAGLEAAGTLTGRYDPPTLDPLLLPLLQIFLGPYPGRQTVRGRKPLRVGNLPRPAGGWFGAYWGASERRS